MVPAGPSCHAVMLVVLNMLQRFSKGFILDSGVCAVGRVFTSLPFLRFLGNGCEPRHIMKYLNNARYPCLEDSSLAFCTSTGPAACYRVCLCACVCACVSVCSFTGPLVGARRCLAFKRMQHRGFCRRQEERMRHLSDCLLTLMCNTGA